MEQPGCKGKQPYAFTGRVTETGGRTYAETHDSLCLCCVHHGDGSRLCQTPEEDVCDGYTDDAWGLCNAFCTAMDCEGDARNASLQACGRVADNFMRATEGKSLPCIKSAAPTDTQAGSCPCNFSLPFWTDPDREGAIVQILPSDHLDLCVGENPGTCLTCSVNYMPGSFTLVSVLANRFVPGQFAEEDKLFFFASQPLLSGAGACGVDTTFASGFSYTTEGFELPVTSSEEFVACALEIEALASAFDNMCMR